MSQVAMFIVIRGPQSAISFQVDSLSLIDYQPADDSILIDPEFEEPLRASAWFCNDGCQSSRVNDSKFGSQSYLASSRFVHLHTTNSKMKMILMSVLLYHHSFYPYPYPFYPYYASYLGLNNSISKAGNALMLCQYFLNC